MNPVVATFIGAGVRWLVMLGAGRGIYASDEATVQITSGVVAVAMLGWSWWQKHRAEELRRR